MTGLRERAREAVRRWPAGARAAASAEQHGNLRQQVRALRRRVAELEAEVLENRQLGRRIAELTDVVEELLLPGDLHDSALLEQRLGQIRSRR